MASIPQKVQIDYEELLELMHQKHHTRKSLAKHLGITAQAFGKYFTTKMALPIPMIIIIMRVLGIQQHELYRFFCTELKSRKAA